MDIFEALALAVLQGLTEFIPVSSSGHLVLAEEFFSIREVDSLAYILLLHLATVLAAAAFYRRDVAELLSALLPPFRNAPPERKKSRRILLLVALATLVTGLIGLTLNEPLERLFQEPRLVACSLFVTGAVLIATSRLSEGRTDLGDFPWWGALLVGLAQGSAIVPGISRSGVTIATALFAGLQRVEAVRLSFLLLIPATAGAALLESGRVASLGGDNLLQSLSGFFAAAVVGYASIYLVVRWTQKGRLWLFGLYCWLVAAVAVAAWLL